MRHCDDYIEDPTQPECLRKFLEYARAPGHGHGLGKKPELFAKLAAGKDACKLKMANGLIVRVVMASRMGDVGITRELDRENGYDARVPLEWLSDFSGSMYV